MNKVCDICRQEIDNHSFTICDGQWAWTPKDVKAKYHRVEELKGAFWYYKKRIDHV